MLLAVVERRLPGHRLREVTRQRAEGHPSPNRREQLTPQRPNASPVGPVLPAIACLLVPLRPGSFRRRRRTTPGLLITTGSRLVLEHAPEDPAR
jgi:hypothetical protein